jgi:hypothetical protein
MNTLTVIRRGIVYLFIFFARGTLDLLPKTSNILAMFLIVEKKIFNTEFVGMCIIYLHVKLNIFDSSGLLVIVSKLKINLHLKHAPFCCLIFYMHKKKNLNRGRIFFR